MSGGTAEENICIFSEAHFLDLVRTGGDVPLYEARGKTVAATVCHPDCHSMASVPSDATEVCRNASLVGLYYAPALLESALKQSGDTLGEKVQRYVDIHHNARSMLEAIPIIGQKFVRKPTDGKTNRFIACNLN